MTDTTEATPKNRASIEDLLKAGTHFGHLTSRWNPKMKPFIFMKRNGIHIINLNMTQKYLDEAGDAIARFARRGRRILFTGTKKQAQEIIRKHAIDCGSPYVVERWLGGTLTNFRTIRERLKRLEELEALEESGDIKNYSKKMESTLNRERTKIRRNLGGIRNMTKMPGALVVIDVNHEMNALKEARKLGIPTICLIDTDSNPDFADIPIPGNDDSLRSIEVIVKSLCAAVAEGKSANAQNQKAKDQSAGEKGEEKPRRRSNRAQFSADAPAESAEPAAAE